MKNYSKKGFTLIELLIVIAVLGTLAVVVLIAINPVQQLARARDAGRSSTIAQLGHAMEAYATINNGVYFLETASCATSGWIAGCLVGAGEIQTVPVNSAYSTLSPAPTCTGTAGTNDSGWCLDSTSAAFVIFARAEATSNSAKCASGTTAFFAYSSTVGKGGLWCGAATGPTTTTNTGWLTI